MKGHHKRNVLVVLSGVLVLGVMILGFMFLDSDEVPSALAASFEITAEKETTAGVKVDSGFLIQSATPLSLDVVQKRIQLKPDQPFQLKKAKDGYLLQPTKPLSPNTLYNIAVSQEDGGPSLSWAFQTENTFMLQSSLPADNTTDVPINSGIELTFSQEVADISKSFSITPEVEGTFEVHGKTVVFVPTGGLTADTVYTITLKAGLLSTAGSPLTTDTAVAFRTSAIWENPEKYGYNSNYFLVTDFMENFLPDEPIAIEVGADQQFDDLKFTLDLYRLNGLEDYLTKARQHQDHVNPTIGRNNDYFVDIAGLQKVQSITDTYHRQGEYSWISGYFILPENPGNGWYLVDITGKDQKLHGQKLIQISDGAVYAQSINGQTMIWINDAATGQAVSGATVSLQGKETTQTATTDQNGLVTMATAKAENAQLRIAFGKKQFGDLISLMPQEETPLANQYYTFVYADREAYQPSDTIKLWGFVLPRQSATPLPDALTLQYDGLNTASINVPLNKDGSFQTEVYFQNRISGYFNFNFMVEDQLLMTKSTLIMAYKKPIYTFTMTNDKAYYRYGDSIQLDIASTFFDGTPAPGVALTTQPKTAAGNLLTGKDGHAQAILTDFSHYNQSCNPFYQTYWINTIGTEDDTTYSSGRALYFPCDYLLTPKKVEKNNSFAIQLSAHKIDFNKVSADTDLYEDLIKTIAGEPAVLSGKITLQKTTYVKKEIGEYYDFIHKVTCKRYQYDPVTKTVQEIPFTTAANGTFTSQTFVYPEKDSYYQAKISFTSPQTGSPYFEEELYIGNTDYPETGGRNRYTFAPADYSKNQLGEQAATPLFLKNNNQPTANQGQIFYTTVQDQVLDYAVTKESTVPFTYQTKYIPNCLIAGAYFDGKHIFSLEFSYLNFDPSQRKLNIKLTADQEHYQPGQTANITAEVTDLTGKPVKANLLLSVADEAAFAVENQYLNVLPDVYDSIYWYPIQVYSSYHQHDMADANKDAATAEVMLCGKTFWILHPSRQR